MFHHTVLPSLSNLIILVQLRSISLSLDSLLDYTEKDFEESTFEVFYGFLLQHAPFFDSYLLSFIVLEFRLLIKLKINVFGDANDILYFWSLALVCAAFIVCRVTV